MMKRRTGRILDRLKRPKYVTRHVLPEYKYEKGDIEERRYPAVATACKYFDRDVNFKSVQLHCEAYNQRIAEEDEKRICDILFARQPSGSWMQRQAAYIKNVKGAKRAVYSYTQDGAQAMNDLLKGRSMKDILHSYSMLTKSVEDMEKDTRRDIAYLEWLISHAPPVTKPFVIYRGAGNISSVEDNTFGDIYTHVGFASSSIYSIVTAEFLQQMAEDTSPLLLRIKVPVGARVLYIGNMSAYPSQAEILLNNQSKFRVDHVGVEKFAFPYPDGTFVFDKLIVYDLTLLPPTKRRM